VSAINSKPLSVLTWGIGLSALLAAALGAATVWLVEHAQTAEQWVLHSLAVQNQTVQVLILVQRMESSQRGYLLTGRNVYLDDYNNAEKALPLLVDERASLFADILGVVEDESPIEGKRSFSRRPSSGCIRTTLRELAQRGRWRSIRAIQSPWQSSTGFSEETARSAGWRLMGLLILRAPVVSEKLCALSVP
jgi:hypothetical protein